MKSYIQDLCGDENPVDIDCAILQCMLQDAIFERLMGPPMKVTVQEVEEALHTFLKPYVDMCMPKVSIDLTLKRGASDESITRTLLL